MTTNHKGMTQAVIAKNRARRLSIKLCPPALSHRHMTMTLCHKATAQRRMSASGCNAPARTEMGTNETHTSAKAKWVLSETRCLRIKLSPGVTNRIRQGLLCNAKQRQGKIRRSQRFIQVRDAINRDSGTGSLLFEVGPKVRGRVPFHSTAVAAGLRKDLELLQVSGRQFDCCPRILLPLAHRTFQNCLEVAG